ncbi:radical SAM family heme chaperone HemW [Alkanindiges illinoisensis]|uniref:radical SAM family heme chaperone HemW n=1 Tax=Alkanindiges illinoisensis TaxID=197183 RepID=UPI0005554377|nr:radical SAM family heme chaperone HemW [Alkanindiges illinoisensis]
MPILHDPVLLEPAVIPLALYIHMPWCVKKCPYCDFNSHALPKVQAVQEATSVVNFPDSALPAALEQAYLQALIQDAAQQQPLAQGRCISSVFIGGGTPSLISAKGYQWLFNQLKALFDFSADCEITLEANPGTLEHQPFADYLEAGINRLSLGVQTFDSAQLQRLGRIHSQDDAMQAITRAREAGFNRLNVDLMHGLPAQTEAQALYDLHTAIGQGATHISWYQLTIEPNTVFFRTQPVLPEDDILADIQQAGEAVLQNLGYVQYEVSAWAKEQPCRHNLNYWQFGDYLAIGAGAHGKVTKPEGIYRFQKTRQPKDYLAQQPASMLNWQAIAADDMPFEFMMNALRLKGGVPSIFYAARTGLSLTSLQSILTRLRQQGLLVTDEQRLQCTAHGFNYLNDVLSEFVME